MLIKYKLGDVVKVRSERVDNPASCSYDKFVGLEHYVSGEIEIKKYGDTSLLKSAMKIFKAGDILVARRNVYLKRASIVKFDGITSGDSIVLQVENKLLRKIIPFVLNTDDFWEYAEKFSDGTMSKRLSPKVLLEYEFILPELDEQEKLAELLWAANNTKEAYKKLLYLTDELVKAQFIEMFGDPETNPFAYQVSTLKDISLTKLTYGSGAAAKDYDGETRYIRITDITDSGELNDDLKSPKKVDDKYLLNEGDILFARTGATVGKTFEFKNIYGRCIYAGFLIRLVPNTEIVLPSYVFAFTKSPYYQKFVAETQRVVAQPNINAQEYGNLKICIPPMKKQIEFETFVKQRDDSKSKLKQNINNIENTIKALMVKNFG